MWSRSDTFPGNNGTDGVNKKTEAAIKAELPYNWEWREHNDKGTYNHKSEITQVLESNWINRGEPVINNSVKEQEKQKEEEREKNPGWYYL